MKAIPVKYSVNRFSLITIAAMVIKFLLHISAAGNYELHRDELLYMDMAAHPAAGYMTVPPLTGLVGYMIKLVAGYSEVALKIVPALMGAATIYLISRIIKELGGKTTALVIACITFICMPGFLLIFSLYTPNAFEVFFWTLLIYHFIRLSVNEKYHSWVWIGAIAGLSFNTKYSVVFLITGFLAAIVLMRRWKLFYSRWFFAGLAAGIILILPNIFWQYQHNWPVLYHMAELKSTQLSNLKYNHFFIDLFSLSSAVIWIWIAGLGAIFLPGKLHGTRLTGVALMLVILMFILLKGKAYYILGVLPFLIASGSCYLENQFEPRQLLLSVSATVLFSLLSLPNVLPVMSFDKLMRWSQLTGKWVPAPFMRWEDGKQYQINQVYADMTGWKELNALVVKAYYSLPENERNNCSIFCQRNYGYAGAVNFYGRQYKLPDAVTFLESYIFWAPDSIPVGSMIYIFYNDNEVKPLFHQSNEVGMVQDNYFREKGLKVFLCSSPRDSVQRIYTESLAAERRKFIRN